MVYTMGRLQKAFVKRTVTRRLKQLWEDLEEQQIQFVTDDDIQHRLPTYFHDLIPKVQNKIDVDSVMEQALPIIVNCYNGGVSPKATAGRIFGIIQF